MDPTTPQPSENGPGATIENGPGATIEIGAEAEVIPAEQVAAEQADQEEEAE